MSTVWSTLVHWLRVLLVAVVIPLGLSYCLCRVAWWYWEERRR